jgi:hypothetical protein
MSHSKNIDEIKQDLVENKGDSWNTTDNEEVGTTTSEAAGIPTVEKQTSEVAKKEEEKKTSASGSQGHPDAVLQITLEQGELETLSGTELQEILVASDSTTLETLLKAKSFKIHVHEKLNQNGQVFYGKELVLLLKKQESQTSQDVKDNNTSWKVVFDLETKSYYSTKSKSVVRRRSLSRKRSKKDIQSFTDALDSMLDWIKKFKTSEGSLFTIRCHETVRKDQLSGTRGRNKTTV